MGRFFANHPRRLRLAVALLIVGLIIAIYQIAFTLPLQRALSATTTVNSAHPAENQAFRRLRQQAANGVIPPDGPAKAAQQIQAMLAAGPAALAPSAWVSIGPGNVGGRLRTIVIHPTTPTTMWLGSASGGVWKTTNGGASWQPLDDFMKSLSVSTLIISPLDANILYAGTGESFCCQTGDGIFKTTNGGSTWTQLTTCPDRSRFDRQWCGVNRLAIAPNGQAILAATTIGVERSTDGGTSWTLVPSLAGTNIQDTNFAPNDNTKAVATGLSATSGAGTAWFSTDGGGSWQLAVFSGGISGAGRIEIAYARSNPTIVYALVDRNNGEIWKSVDGGHTYAKLTIEVWQTPDPMQTTLLHGQGWYDNSIWVDPTDPNRLLAGGVELFRSSVIAGGLRFDRIGGPTPPLDPCCLHPDQHIVIEAPGYNGSTNKTVYVGNDGGIYKANDVTTVAYNSGWQRLQHQLNITQFYGAAGNGANVIVGGTQDNGILQYDPRRANAPEVWTTPVDGDGGVCAADPTDPNYFYGGQIYLGIVRSTDGGQTFPTQLSGGMADYGRDDRVNFIPPFILDPNNPNAMLAGGASLWRSVNVKATSPSWRAIKSPGATPISAIAVAPGNPDLIWVGYNSGEIYKTTNGAVLPPATPTWTPVYTGLPQTYVTRLTIDPRNPNIAYAAHGTWDGQTIYRTTNGGASWSLATGSGATKLPDLPVYSLSIDPLNSKALFAGTEMGVFASTDSGATWQVSTGGPANVPVEELFWQGRMLVAVTYGRGLFSQSIAPPHKILLPLIRNDQTASAASVAYPPPPTPGPYPPP